MNKRILVIENNTFILELLRDLLIRFGYDVECIETGREALERLNQIEFDLIFLDIHLEDMNGRAVFQKLRERSPGLAQRVIFVTGDLGNTETEIFLKESGNLWLPKPFTLKEIQQILESFFHDKKN
jgi:CheY-like chemotaxis protein